MGRSPICRLGHGGCTSQLRRERGKLRGTQHPRLRARRLCWAPRMLRGKQVHSQPALLPLHIPPGKRLHQATEILTKQPVCKNHLFSLRDSRAVDCFAPHTHERGNAPTPHPDAAAMLSPSPPAGCKSAPRARGTSPCWQQQRRWAGKTKRLMSGEQKH